jgi:signal transduction histidine kinase
VTRFLDALTSEDLGCVILTRGGGLRRISPGIATLLSGRDSEDAAFETTMSIDQWAAEIPVEDRAALLEAILDPEPRLQVRVGPGPRWYDVRPLPISSDTQEVGLLLVDQTERIEHGRRNLAKLRQQRIVASIAEALSSTDTVEETTTEILATLGEDLELAAACWLTLDEDGSWIEIASWRHQDLAETGLPSLPMHDLLPRLAGGLPAVSPAVTPRSIVIPILLKGDVVQALRLDSLRVEVWSADSIELLTRIGDAIARRVEEQAAETEREAWAAQRGSLERSEAIAQLTSGVAHDFNGVLFAILGRFELLRLKTEDPAILAEIDEIERTVQEAKRLADRLRQALKGGDASDQPVTVQPELGAIVATISRVLPSRVEFHAAIALPESPITVITRRNTLQQILLNLVANARNAIGAHGRVQLGARLLTDGRLELRVDDDGPGIPKADRDRLMEPYETGDDSDGVGLGLAICRRLAKEAGGDLRLDDSPLGGLAACVTLPVRTDAGTPASPTAAALRDPRHVIVVEDNDIIRDVLVRVFEGLGATVHALPHAVDLERVLADHSDIDLLVLDIDLPRRTGTEALADLRRSGITIPCLLVTGGLADQPELDRVGLLRKPFKIDVLRQAARLLLAESTSADS